MAIDRADARRRCKIDGKMLAVRGSDYCRCHMPPDVRKRIRLEGVHGPELHVPEVGEIALSNPETRAWLTEGDSE